MSVHFMACYPTRDQGESAFAKSAAPCDRTWSEWNWRFVEKIYNLHHEVIMWPTSWANPDGDSNDEPIFIITVDGVHCQIEEPTLESFDENRKYYSHKFNGPALDYEIAMSVFAQKCVWINGPFPAGTSDLKVFRQGLKQKIEDARASGIKHRGIVDRGYEGEAECLSLPSSQDDEAVRDFKGRALSRHETFNGRMKFFDCLDDRFRHRDLLKHKWCFFAVAVIVQLGMDFGSPLFDV